MHKILLLFFILTTGVSWAQRPDFTIIQQGSPSGDSSYYDICRISSDEYWAIGKRGIITRINSSGLTIPGSYPNQGEDLLNMAKLDDSNYLICGDKGLVYHYNMPGDHWTVTRVKGYENSCFYSICAVDGRTAFISGGRSEIVNSQRVIPFGFILKTEDGGKTWNKIYSSVTQMIWSIKYNPQTSRLSALTYSPVKTKIIVSPDKGYSWKTISKIKGLYHDFNNNKQEMVLAGGKNGNFLKNGNICSGNKKIPFNTGLFWDVEDSGDFTLVSGSHGNMLIKDNFSRWELIPTPVKNNLYEICFIDEKSAFLVGNNKTILKVDFR